MSNVQGIFNPVSCPILPRKTGSVCPRLSPATRRVETTVAVWHPYVV